MYSEQLVTPHPDQQQPTRPLLDAVQATSGSTLVEHAALITDIVHATLRNCQVAIGELEISEPAVAAAQSSNCYGFNIVLSESLEHAGIPHYVGYANGHTVTLLSDGLIYAHLFDAQSPRFNADVLLAIPARQLTTIPEQIDQSGRATTQFFSQDLIARSSFKRSIDELAVYNRWLTFTNPERDPRSISLTRERKNTILLASWYAPTIGRMVLQTHNAVHRAINQGQAETAATQLHAIHGLYPEVDTRNTDDYQQLGKLIMRLSQTDQAVLAETVITDVAEGAEQSRNVNVQTWQADQYRRLGLFCHDKTLLERALTVYEQAYTITPQTVIAEKAKKTRRLMAGLAS